MPTIPTDSFVKLRFHLAPEMGARRLASVPSSIELEYRAANAQLLPGEAMVVFPAVPHIAGKTLNRQVATRLPNRFRLVIEKAIRFRKAENRRLRPGKRPSFWQPVLCILRRGIMRDSLGPRTLLRSGRP